MLVVSAQEEQEQRVASVAHWNSGMGRTHRHRPPVLEAAAVGLSATAEAGEQRMEAAEEVQMVLKTVEVEEVLKLWEGEVGELRVQFQGKEEVERETLGELVLVLMVFERLEEVWAVSFLQAAVALVSIQSLVMSMSKRAGDCFLTQLYLVRVVVARQEWAARLHLVVLELEVLLWVVSVRSFETTRDLRGMESLFPRPC